MLDSVTSYKKLVIMLNSKAKMIVGDNQYLLYSDDLFIYMINPFNYDRCNSFAKLLFS